MNSENKPTLSNTEIDLILINHFGHDLSADAYLEFAAWGRLDDSHNTGKKRDIDFMQCLNLLVSRPQKHQSRSQKHFTMDELRDGIFDEQTIE